VAILQDLQGPGIRVGRFANGAWSAHGAEFTITSREVAGDDRAVSTTYKNPIDEGGRHHPPDDGYIQLR
jgi:pyruvate kinase